MGRGLGMMAADKYIYISFLLSMGGRVRKHSRAKLVIENDTIIFMPTTFNKWRGHQVVARGVRKYF